MLWGLNRAERLPCFLLCTSPYANRNWGRGARFCNENPFKNAGNEGNLVHISRLDHLIQKEKQGANFYSRMDNDIFYNHILDFSAP